MAQLIYSLVIDMFVKGIEGCVSILTCSRINVRVNDCIKRTNVGKND